MQYIYLIKCQQFYKIGIANDVQSRLAQLATGNPFDLEVQAVYGFENANNIETVLHQRFVNNRRRGEWFHLDSQQIDILHQVCQLLGGIGDTLPTIECEDVEAAEEDQHTEEILIGGINWRLEKRNDRNPPGYAIVQRGSEKKYLGYIGMKNLKNPLRPTIEEIEAVILENAKNKS